MAVAIPEHPVAISSRTMQWSRTVCGEPPYSAGTCGFMKPCLKASRQISRGNSPERSNFMELGPMNSLVNARARSTNSVCSALGPKSIISPPEHR